MVRTCSEVLRVVRQGRNALTGCDRASSLHRGAEVADVPLSELLFRSLVHFLQTGRYVDCRLVAQSYSYAEDRALNALQQQATAEDLAFDYGRYPPGAD
jgi:hypothetical protein